MRLPCIFISTAEQFLGFSESRCKVTSLLCSESAQKVFFQKMAFFLEIRVFQLFPEDVDMLAF